MALDVEGGDPIKAIGILECAKLDLHRSIDKQEEPTGNFEMLTN